MSNWIPKGAVPYKKNQAKLDKLNKKRQQYSTTKESSQLKLFK